MKKEEILYNVVYEVTGITKEDLDKQQRLRRISDPRRMVAYILHEKMNYVLEHAGLIMNRDHATVLYLCKSHKLLMETNDDYKTVYNKIYSEWYYRCNHVKYEPNIYEVIEQILSENEKTREQIIKLKRMIIEDKKQINP
jgi:hypothetical protein